MCLPGPDAFDQYPQLRVARARMHPLAPFDSAHLDEHIVDRERELDQRS